VNDDPIRLIKEAEEFTDVLQLHSYLWDYGELKRQCRCWPPCEFAILRLRLHYLEEKDL